MTKALQRTISSEEKTKRELEGAINRKKRKLTMLAAKAEILRMELETIRHEYNIRVGALIIKDNKLDLEIIRLRSLKRLLGEGLSLEEAINHERDSYYNEMLEMGRQEEEIEIERRLLKQTEQTSEEEKEKLRKLWKKLIIKFHPDLVMDQEEKKEREEIMKKINNAYSQRDFETLELLEKNHKQIVLSEMTIHALEKMLLDIENMIIHEEDELLRMQKSEWFSWKRKFQKAKKEEKDIFNDLERRFLDDIVRKTHIVRILEDELGVYRGIEI